MSKRRTRLAFLVTEDWYFCSHRLPLARAAQAAGYDVTVVTRVRNHGDPIRAAGLRLVPFENDRASLNPVRELGALWRLIRIYRRERPDIVHQVAMKPVLFGTIAARLSGRPRVINALAGLGWLFASPSGLARGLKRIVRVVLRWALRSGTVIVQNPDDARDIARLGVPESRIHVVEGSGVNLVEFQPRASHNTEPHIVLPARMLWDKGVGEFVEAARQLRAKGVRARFILAGDPDPLNPASISRTQLADWVREGIVEHLGWVTDMPGLLARCDIVCLPSYHEGMPKSLIEAAAMGLPIVATDVPGCRAVVRHEFNGLLVPVKDARALASALERLIGDASLRRDMGARGRRRAEEEFDVARVIRSTLALYA